MAMTGEAEGLLNGGRKGPKDSVPKRSTRRQDRAHKAASRTFVEHRYHDHYNDPSPSTEPQNFTTMESRAMVASPRGGTATAFPDKLYAMLAATSAKGRDDVVSWQPHGRCFVIHKKEVFVTEIMPQFFQQTKLTSFQRQLNLYGFIRLTAGKDRGGYYHEFFLRGRPDLCCFMVRTRIKGNGMKASSSPETEPDFYSFEPCIDRSIKAAKLSKPDPVHKSIDVELGPSNDLASMMPKAPSQDRRSAAPTKNRIVSPPPFKLFSPGSEIDMLKLLDDALTVPSQSSSELSSGDVVFFEGLRFHYLDRMDLDEAGSRDTVAL